MKPYICGEISTVTFDPGLQTCACHVARIVFSNSGYWNYKQIPIQLLGEVTFGGTRKMDEMEMPMGEIRYIYIDIRRYIPPALPPATVVDLQKFGKVLNISFPAYLFLKYFQCVISNDV